MPSAFPEEFEDAAGYGWTVEDATFDWPTLIANKDKQIARLNGYYRRAVERAGGIIIDDRAVLKDRAHDPSRPLEPRCDGGDDPHRHRRLSVARWPMSRAPSSASPRTMRSISRRCPRASSIVGGGYIALEFAHIFHGLGAEVTLIYRGAEGAARLRRGFARLAPGHDAPEGHPADPRYHAHLLQANGAEHSRRQPPAKPARPSRSCSPSAAGRTRRPRPRERGREAHAARPYRGGQLLAHLGRQHLCGGRRDRQARADAGRHPRGDVLREDRLRRARRPRPITS